MVLPALPAVVEHRTTECRDSGTDVGLHPLERGRVADLQDTEKGWVQREGCMGTQQDREEARSAPDASGSGDTAGAPVPDARAGSV